MFNAGLAAGNVQPYFLTQADVKLDGSTPLAQQPGLAQIQDQALQVAEVFTAFIGAATQQLDIAIYDFRLLDGPLTDQIVGAVKAAAARGVSVRLAYNRVETVSHRTASGRRAQARRRRNGRRRRGRARPMRYPRSARGR